MFALRISLVRRICNSSGVDKEVALSVCVCMHECLSDCVHACVCLIMYMCVHVCVHVCVCVCACVRVCVNGTAITTITDKCCVASFGVGLRRKHGD